MKRSRHFDNETKKLPPRHQAPVYARAMLRVFLFLTRRAFGELNETLVYPFRFPTWPIAAALLLMAAVLALAMVANPAGPERSVKMFMNATWVSIAAAAFAYLFVGLQNAWKWVGSSALHMTVVFMVYAVIGLGVFNGIAAVDPLGGLLVIWMMAYLMLLTNWLGVQLMLALVRKRVDL